MMISIGLSGLRFLSLVKESGRGRKERKLRFHASTAGTSTLVFLSRLDP